MTEWKRGVIHRRWLPTVVVLALVATCGARPAEAGQGSAPTSWAPLSTLHAVEDPALARFFAQRVDVFGIPVAATAATPNAKVMHAANVLAQYLDNDEDGSPDDPQVVAAMRANHALLVMFATFEELQKSGFRQSEVHKSYRAQDLEGHETQPAKGFDATLEEVLHLITDTGYAEAYPAAFRPVPGSKIAQQMDHDRGGHFEGVPARYPEKAIYHYDDQTCHYDCMVGEYFYWGLTTLLGAQASRCAEIAREWEPCTPQLLKEMAPGLHALLTDPAYRLPSVLPDGAYRGRNR